MRSPNLSLGCLGLLQDLTFLPCALSEILHGSSSLASAPETASLILLCTKVLIYLNYCLNCLFGYLILFSFPSLLDVISCLSFMTW